jgi:SAM-dependent methyltransferase
MSKRLTPEQQIQEDEYLLPMHYLDLIPQLEYMWKIPESYRKICRELLGPLKGQRVLDACCGDGRMCYNLRNDDLKLVGIDYSARAIAFARAFNPETEFVVGDLTTYRPTEKFDAIFLIEALEHFQPEFIKNALENLWSCLADDGLLIVTVPSTLLAKTPKHYQHFTPDSLRATLSPWFTVQTLLGQLRWGRKYRLYNRMVSGQFVLGALRLKFRIMKPYFAIIDRLFTSIERCEPEKALRLIAACRKNPGAGR